MINRMWETLLHGFSRKSHQSCLIPCPTGCERHCFFCLGTHQSYDQLEQQVSDTALFVCQSVSESIIWPHQQYVRDHHCFISLPGNLINYYPIPTGSEWHCIVYLQGSLIMSHPMTNSMWEKLLYFFARQSHQSWLMPWPTGSEWHCFISSTGGLIKDISCHDQQGVSVTVISLPGTLINCVQSHDQQGVSANTALFLC